MSTRIVRACDRCETTPAVEWGPFIGRMVDLCDPCANELVEPLAALVRERGHDAPAPVAPRRASRAGAVGGQFVCILCSRASPTSTGLSSHLATDHGLTATELYGTVCPVCGEEPPQLGVHGRTHGLRGASALMAWARDNGDPHGLYAARILPHRDGGASHDG